MFTKYTFAELRAHVEYCRTHAMPSTRNSFYNGERKLSIEEFRERQELASAHDSEDVMFHTGERISYSRALELLMVAQDGMPVGEVLARFGQWVITKDYCDCLAAPWYSVARKSVVEDPKGWKRHLLEKVWVEPNNWIMTVDWCVANQHTHGIHWKVKRSLRVRILARDNGRCQLCGAKASEGARLEVDHIVPKSQGGGNHPSNLWSLCFDCNRGKRDRSLQQLREST